MPPKGEKQTTIDKSNLPIKEKLQQKIANIYPPEGYLPHGRTQYEQIIQPKGMTYILIGSIDAIIQPLPTDVTFETFEGYQNKDEKIPAGTHAIGIRDINPFSYRDPIPNPDLRTHAKYYMTIDLLRLLWKAEEIDPEIEIAYVLTNPQMAKFMCKRWGFNTLREGDDELLAQLEPPDQSYVVYATKDDIEGQYRSIFEYLEELESRKL